MKGMGIDVGEADRTATPSISILASDWINLLVSTRWDAYMWFYDDAE